MNTIYTDTLTENPSQLLAKDSAPNCFFVELLARSNFSFLQGASHPEELVQTARELNYQGLALCDVNGLYGIARGYRAATQTCTFSNEVTPTQAFRYHVGSELTSPDGNVVLLPMNKKGYSNLCRLITDIKRSAPKNFSSLQDDQIFFYNEGLVCFLLPPWDHERLLRFQTVFSDRLHLPVWRDMTWESHVLFQQALAFEKLGFSLFATQRPFFHLADRKPLHDILTCLYHRSKLKTAEQLLLSNRERCLHSKTELFRRWQDRPDLLLKTVSISDQLQFCLNEIRYRYPLGELPEKMTSSDYLRSLCLKGFFERLHPHQTTCFLPDLNSPHWVQIEKELNLIHELQYEDYFLTLYEICQFAQAQGILYQGRGSAANSVVCFVLGLTNVNPNQVNLLFERFLSKERSEPPDIDIDFEHERREEVIQHIYRKYGAERAAMVCNVICYRTRMAIRDVCRVFDIADEKISALVRFMGREGLTRLLTEPQIFEKLNLDAELSRQILELASQLRGFPRHLGIHSGGFVLAEDCLLNEVPIEKATMQGRYVVQWNKDDIETLGLMKVDLLSLGMLSALKKSLTLLKEFKNIDWKLYQIPQEDKATYQMISKADTIGVFQIESRAQMSLLPRLKPKTYYDLVIEVAIVRPGPIQGGMIHPYLRRRDGTDSIRYAHPKLEKILSRTLGVPLFQEQIMQVVIAIADFSPGEADQMRRIMSNAWRKAPQMKGVRERLFQGMRLNQIEDTYIEQIYKTIEGFASYGFPESHAASFALLTYASCYIKCHHPDVFLCALLNSQPMGFYSPRALVADAERHQVKVLPLSIQDSDWDYTLAPQLDSTTLPQGLHAVRTGFCSVRGLCKNSLQKILINRKKMGPFLNLEDFLQRTQVSLPLASLLAKAGAFSCWSLSSREISWRLASYCYDPSSFFFAQAPHTEKSWSPAPESNWQTLAREYHTKGFSIGNHPLKLMRPELLKLNHLYKQRGHGISYLSSLDLSKMPHQSWVRTVGLLSLHQRPPTAKGVSFLTLEDEFGLMNIVLRPKIYEKYRLTLQKGPIFEIFGQLERQNGVINLMASGVIERRPPL